jgi:hypothetical protein
MRICGGLLSLALLSCVPHASSAQVKSYDVIITCTGYIGSMNFAAGEPGCPLSGESGTDVYTGCVTGDESDLESEQEVWYYGDFLRSTEVSACDTKRLRDGTDVYCATKITGSARMKGEISIYADRDGANIGLEPEPGQGPGTTTGSCDGELTAELAAAYPTTEGAGLETYPAGPLRPGLYSDSPDDPFAPGFCAVEVKSVASC